MAAARAGVRFKRTCVAADLSSFPPLARTKLSKIFQERIQSSLSPHDANKTGGLENEKGALPPLN